MTTNNFQTTSTMMIMFYLLQNNMNLAKFLTQMFHRFSMALQSRILPPSFEKLVMKYNLQQDLKGQILLHKLLQHLLDVKRCSFQVLERILFFQASSVI